MFEQDELHEIMQAGSPSALPQAQLDWRWIERYRRLCAYDSYWWLSWAGPFTEEEQKTWDHLFAHPLDEATKAQLSKLMNVSRERELAAALAEQREPRLHYPAIQIEDIRSRITAQRALREEIKRLEPNAIVRRLYVDALEEELDYLYLIEATYEKDNERFWACNLRLFPKPSPEHMRAGLARIKHLTRQGLEHPHTAEISRQVQEFVQTRLHLSLDLTPEEEAHPERIQSTATPATPPRTLSMEAARRFFTQVLSDGGYTDWQVTIDPNAVNMRVEKGARQIHLPDKRFSLAQIKHLFIHELAGHVARCIAGERSALGLLGIQTKNDQLTEEGRVLYFERQAAKLRGETFDDSGSRIGALTIGLACGVMTAPQTFLSLFAFLERYSLLARLLRHPEAQREELEKDARQYALSMCLRTFRGVPDLEQPGICYLHDVIYLHGLRLIEKAVAQDETILDRLAVGRVGLEYLPDVEALGIVSAPQPFKDLVYDPNLDSYILSFAPSEEGTESMK